MRTTININDNLLAMLKRRAAESNRTLTAVIEDALRLALQEKSATGASPKLKIPISGRGGLLPGVDLDDTASLLDHMEGRS